MLTKSDIQNILIFLGRASKTGAESDVMEELKRKLVEMQEEMQRANEEKIDNGA